MSSKAVAPLVQAECFSSIETILDDARNGRMFILLDDEDRENEGDLVIPAQMVTPRVVNFMAAHGRGLICLCLTSERVAQLGLSPMAVRNDAPHATAFTVSIEARDGVTTGISAADRARTISVAIHASNGPEAIVTPGHVFPLAARDGGVLVRAGHTEAAVDIARLAGLNPSGVICEIMNDDGTMARRDDLIAFAGRYGLHLATIRDLIAYRRRHDRLVEPVSETPFHSEYGGDWRLIRYRNRVDGSEAGVLQMGSVTENRPTLVRVHTVAPLDDMLGRIGSREKLLQRAMKEIAREGAGLLVVFDRADPEAPSRHIRSYGIGAQILAHLGVHDMILLSNSPQLPVALEGHGLAIVECRPIPKLSTSVSLQFEPCGGVV
jgi:3,4-dihydroxy 2-butanone 4-phosphate synthase/GTP cyclohydrolase II